MDTERIDAMVRESLPDLTAEDHQQITDLIGARFDPELTARLILYEIVNRYAGRVDREYLLGIADIVKRHISSEGMLKEIDALIEKNY